jgi:glycosyltransferase involved in cell wall biosynthesis
LLSKAFFKADVKESHLLIAGSCNQPEIIQEINQNKNNQSGHAKLTIHARFIPDDEIQLYMRAADCVVLSYDDVPMNPGSVILAMSFGLPVCCVNTGSVAEILGPRCLFSYEPRQFRLYGGCDSRDLNLCMIYPRGETRHVNWHSSIIHQI